MHNCQNHPEKPVMAKGLCAACYMKQRRAQSSTYIGRKPNGSNYPIAMQRQDEWMPRFLSKIDRSGDCHIWRGQKTNGGYGVFSVAGMTLLAHRLVRAMHGGDTSAAVVMHTCDNPSCVNPDHLQDGTYLDNSRDMVEKGRQPDPANLGQHLKDRHNHPKARRVSTPSGEFASAALAAEAFSIKPRTAQRWANDCRNGWKWID